MKTDVTLTTPGEFVVGCNYWASHAGTRTWADWRPEIVDRDFQRLSEAGVQVLRVFPLWPDFQPLKSLLGGRGQVVEFRHGEEPFPDDACGRAGMSQVAMDHFAEFLDLAEKHGLKLIVGLLTGWMSGRLHVPDAFAGHDVLTDAVPMRWELRFVRHFVGTFKGHPAIAGWDLGNECNCMGSANRDQAFVWTAAITNAIRAVDPSRPVVSGLHGLRPEGNWTMQDQGELVDVLTTHPYAIFTRHCDHDPLNTIRTVMHSTAESRMYADIGGKPCLCQEIGSLGPVMASEKIAADFARTCLFSLWANDCHGFLWWCANDQTELAHAPYDWAAMERELGLLRVDGSPKPALDTIGGFGRFVEGLPFGHLPLRSREAVCILTEGQDHWGVAFSAFILAKQAGFDIEFQHESQPIRDAPLYLLPCLSGHRMIPRRRLLDLLAKVEAGATLYLSMDSALGDRFEPLTGLEPQVRERRREFGRIRLEGLPGAPSIPCGGQFKVRMTPTRAEVLGREEDGNPAFTVASYGKGKVYVLNVPMEMLLTTTSGSFHAPAALPCWQVYRHIAAEAVRGRAVRKENPFVAVTEHALGEDRRVVVVVNHATEPIREDLALQGGWKVAEVLYGEVRREPGRATCLLPANDAAVMVIDREA
ncbi:MAG: beta-mannanase [Armatimonadetes bacterium]|nr:beta-mannanase [Armatimonadota bacterium]